MSFGFKSVKTLPKNEHLNAYENNLYDNVRNIEFKNVKSSFQQQLKNDAKLLIPTDKTNNSYRVTTDEYNELLTENISKSYKKTDKPPLNGINTEANNIAKDLKLGERIEQHSQHQSFITLKDIRTIFRKIQNVD